MADLKKIYLVKWQKYPSQDTFVCQNFILSKTGQVWTNTVYPSNLKQYFLDDKGH